MATSRADEAPVRMRFVDVLVNLREIGPGDQTHLVGVGLAQRVADEVAARAFLSHGLGC